MTKFDDLPIEERDRIEVIVPLNREDFWLKRQSLAVDNQKPALERAYETVGDGNYHLDPNDCIVEFVDPLPATNVADLTDYFGIKYSWKVTRVYR